MLAGLFLLWPDLRTDWGLSLFLQVAPEETYRRMALRDGTPADPHDPRNRRYLLGEQRSLDQSLQGHADLIIDNTAVQRPVVVPRPDEPAAG